MTSSAQVRTHMPRLLAVAIVTLVVTGCSREAETPVAQSEPGVAPAAAANAQVQWAREALGRNPQLEVVAADEERGVLTVRQRESGQVMAVRLNELAAAPVALLQAPSDAPSATTAAAAPETRTTTEVTRTQTTTTPGTASAPPADMTPDAAQQTSGDIEGSYVIQREGGQVRVSGPGVSIVSADQNANARGGGRSSPANTPIVCDGKRFLHLDQRDLTVEGTALIARNGCELHVTNSRIRASGAALSVHNATVHVANSTLQGDTASIEALGRSRLYLRGSTFEGISHRDETAELNDQGGNTWR